MRAFKVARVRPRGISGAAFLYGYLSSAVRRAPQVEDLAFRRFVRRELRMRILNTLGLHGRNRRAAGTVAAQASGSRIADSDAPVDNSVGERAPVEGVDTNRSGEGNEVTVC
jgi:hypothetical protein